MMNDLPDRYHRQTLLPEIGEAGQRRLRAAHALVAGVGALGAAIAETLARAGVGTITLVDRDVVDLTNLQRQALFTEDDARDARPKADAAKAAIGRINADVTVRAVVDDLNFTNAPRLAEGARVLLDGLDNFQTRYLLNDLAVKTGRPYVYAGAVGTGGMGFVVRPATEGAGPGPCLRCLFPEPPGPGEAATCDTAGILASAAAWAAHWQATQAIKLLLGEHEAVDASLVRFDLWRNEFRRFDVARSRDPRCPCCARREFDWLEGRAGAATAVLCGRNAVQINPDLDGATASLDLDRLAARLKPHGTFRAGDALLRGTFARERASDGTPIGLLVFPSGRAVVSGVNDPAAARRIYDAYVGG